MKKTLLVAILAIGLSGCVAVPVYDGGYAAPAYGYYPAPAASVSFGFYGHGHRHHHHRHHRHHRHHH